MFRDQRPPRHKGSFSLDFGRMGLRHEGKSLAWSSGGSSGLTDRKFRTTNLGSGLKVRRPRTIGQNLPIFDSFSSLFARVQYCCLNGPLVLCDSASEVVVHEVNEELGDRLTGEGHLMRP